MGLRVAKFVMKQLEDANHVVELFGKTSGLGPAKVVFTLGYSLCGKDFRIGTVRYNWPMSAHASQAVSIAHCTEDLPYGE